MRSLPEMAALIALETGDDANVLHGTIRGYRDKNYFQHCAFQGRKALYDDTALARVRLLLSLQDHGFEGVKLANILSLIDNHDAPPVPGKISPAGFARVIDGIKAGEHWNFRFSADNQRMFWGGCRIHTTDSEKNYDIFEDELGALKGCHVVTMVDLSALLAPLLKGD